jgi:Na+-transporting NADH:ubiquinone oxidoreductase subunit C
MMIAARILNPEGYFQIQDSSGEYVPAKEVEGGVLVPGSKEDIPSPTQLLTVYYKRLHTYLVDPEGNLTTFEAAKIDETEYLNKYRKEGYYTQPYKLIYEILPNAAEKGDASEAKAGETVDGYVIPVNGQGLWNAIYGYLAIRPDGNKVIGVSWYQHGETPGLGAVIAEPGWQSQFFGKQILQSTGEAIPDAKSASVGIIVLRGKVSEVLGTSPKAASAVDGITGATLTGNGVVKAYQDVLEAYRPFLVKLQEQHKK